MSEPEVVRRRAARVVVVDADGRVLRAEQLVPAVLRTTPQR